MKGKDRIPYYFVRPNGRGYWEPTRRMRELGFCYTPCGVDGPEAREIARRPYEDYKAGLPPRERNPRSIVHRLPPNEAGYVYFLACGNRVKIGFTRRLGTRFSAIQTGSGSADMAFAVRGLRSDEAKMHRRLYASHLDREWFSFSEDVRRVMMRSVAFGRPMHDPDENEPRTVLGSAQPKSLHAVS